MNTEYWWTVPEGMAYKTVFAYLKKLESKQGHISEANLRNMRLYGNADILGMRIGKFHKTNSKKKVTLNVIKVCVDTIVSKLVQNKPKPTFLTDGGNWGQQQRAKKLDQFTHGALYQSKTYENSPMVLKDGAVFGTGCLHYYFTENDSIRSERVFPEELKVDEDEAIYGKPRGLHRVKYISKDIVKAKFPGMESVIDKASSPEEHYMYDKTNPNMIAVVESYRLPSSSTAMDGRHTICIESADLLNEEWTHEWWPFEFFYFDRKLLGFWGMGVAELLTGLQIEINKLLMRIQDIMHLGSVPKIFLQKGSKITKSRLNNMIGNVIEFTGTMPEMKSLLNVPIELFDQLERLYKRSFEIAGVSQLSAQSQKPQGLDSGKALREFTDIESERFMTVSEEWENFHLRCAELLINMAKMKDEELKADGKEGFVVINPSENGLAKIKWSEIDLDKESYVMQKYPTNLFSKSPSSRLSEVTELLSIGFLTKEEANALVQYPDIKYRTSLINSHIDDIDAVIDRMIFDGKYESPESFQDLQLGISMVQAAYLKYRRLGAPQERLELLREWMSSALAMINPEPERLMIEQNSAPTKEEQLQGRQVDEAINADNQMTISGLSQLVSSQGKIPEIPQAG